MSIGPMIGIPASVAGVPVAQTYGTELDRLRHDTQFAARRQAADDAARQAAGIGQTPADQETSDSGAGNRQEWAGYRQFERLQKAAVGSSAAAPCREPATGTRIDLTA